jgi:peptidase E
MKLFLASEAKHPESLNRLREFVGGFAGKSIAYIPTASNGERPYGSWKTESGSWDLLQSLQAKVTPVVLEEYKDASVLEVLRKKDIIWVGGGMCGYLLYWMRRCAIDTHIRELLDDGCVYVGSSAGSMVTAKTLSVLDWYIGESEAGASVIPGLGLVDFSIYPHYADSFLPEIKKRWQGEKLYLLKNGEAITVVDGNITVLGEERVLFP